jgi:hypothetical protein
VRVSRLADHHLGHHVVVEFRVGFVPISWPRRSTVTASQ